MNKTIVVISSATVLLLGVITAGVVYAQVVTRDGDTIAGRLAYVEISGPDIVCKSIENDGYEDIPGMTKTFSQGGLLANEVIINFSGEFVDAEAGPQVPVRVLVDGIVQPGAGEGTRLKDFGGGGSGNRDAGTWSYISTPLSPGSHTVTLQWAREVSPGNICLRNRSLIINHR